jgi:hypothetical protein
VVKTKMKCAAKVWMECMDDELLTMVDVVEKFRLGFAITESSIVMHERMKGRGQNKRESTMNYVFEMNAMGKNGGMADTTIVQYIIRGLCSADLREVVVASCPTDLENLMQNTVFGILLSVLKEISLNFSKFAL